MDGYSALAPGPAPGAPGGTYGAGIIIGAYPIGTAPGGGAAPGAIIIIIGGAPPPRKAPPPPPPPPPAAGAAFPFPPPSVSPT